MAKKAEVVSMSLFRRRGSGLEDEPEVVVGLPPSGSVEGQGPASTVTGIDLSGKPKVLFLIGAGNSGKTVEARYLGWRMAEAGRQAVIAALDPGARSLATWFDGVEQPPNADGTQTARWLRQLLEFAMAEKQSALLDFGAGNTALGKLLDAAPRIVQDMDDAGVAPVALYVFGPRQDDLALLAGLEDAGFRPAATALLLNEGRVDSTMDREEAFARVLRHSAYRAAVARGAIPIWLPRLEPEVMMEVEGKRLHFGQAQSGQVPEGRTFAPIGGFGRSMVARWVERMDQAHKPIGTWLP